MILNDNERIELQHQARPVTFGRTSHAARLILLLSDGHTWADIQGKLDCCTDFIDLWSKRFAAERLAGPYSRHAGPDRFKVTDKIEARVLALTAKHRPADGSTHWSSRELAAELGDGISHMTIARSKYNEGPKPVKWKYCDLRRRITLDSIVTAH